MPNILAAMIPNNRTNQGFTLIELLVTMFLIAILISMLLPAVQQCREAARKTQCCSNLAQIGLALHNYEQSHNVLPPGSVNPTGPIRSEAVGYHLSWIAQLLPFVDQQYLFQQIDSTAGAYDERNRRVRQTRLALFQCPTDFRCKTMSIPSSSYVGVTHEVEAPIDVDSHGAFVLNRAVSLEAITDGVSSTLYVGEKALPLDDLGWLSGTRATLRNTGLTLNQDIQQLRSEFPTTPSAAPDVEATTVGGFSSHHDSGAFFLFGDGRATFSNQHLDVVIYRQLANRSDGELLDPGSFW